MKKYFFSFFIVLFCLLIATKEVLAAPFVYVLSERSGPTKGNPATISLINVNNSYSLTTPITTATRTAKPQTIAISPDQTKVYISDRGLDLIYVVDTANNTFSTIAVDNDGELVITPDGTKGYIGNCGSQPVVIWVLNLSNNTVSGSIPVTSTSCPFFLAVSPDGSKLYASGTFDNGSFGVTVINTANNAILANIQIAPDSTFIQDIVVSNDGSKVYVVDPGACCPTGLGRVYVINAATNLITNNITVGNTPVGLALTPDDSKLYVANQASSSVSVINTATNTVLTTINLGAGKKPSLIKITPDGTKAFVLNQTAPIEVSVINTATDVLITTVVIPNTWSGFDLGIFDRGFTKAGSNVVIKPTPAVTLTFSSVTTSGDTSVTTSATPPAVPDGFKVAGSLYFTITSTATFSGSVTVCIKYTDETGENGFKFLHEEGGVWVNRTSSLDTVNNIICGQVISFSNFVVAIAPTITGLSDRLASLSLPQGLTQSLLAKLEAAQRALDAGQNEVAVNNLQAFINEVEAQRGKVLTNEQADNLASFVTNLIKVIKGIVEF